MTPEESKEVRTWLVVRWICFRETFKKNLGYSLTLIAVSAAVGGLFSILKFIF